MLALWDSSQPHRGRVPLMELQTSCTPVPPQGKPSPKRVGDMGEESDFI